VRTLKLTLAYDGTSYVGWQRQAAGESIQGLLERALMPFDGTPIVVHGAGRTDAGVHALGQVASLQFAPAHDPATVLKALNARLPVDVRVLAVEVVPDDFHARFSATGKTYRYQIRNAPIANPFERLYEWHLSEPLDIPAMQQAARALVGRHDFAAFQSAGTEVSSTVRTMHRAEVRGENDVLTFEISGDGFLRHMVRALAGTLVDVGRGTRAPENMARLLGGAARSDAGATAPPHGLFLMSVHYD
jgi:tRNA pseudouridine38-40 synthase